MPLLILKRQELLAEALGYAVIQRHRLPMHRLQQVDPTKPIKAAVVGGAEPDVEVEAMRLTTGGRPVVEPGEVTLPDELGLKMGREIPPASHLMNWWAGLYY